MVLLWIAILKFVTFQQNSTNKHIFQTPQQKLLFSYSFRCFHSTFGVFFFFFAVWMFVLMPKPISYGYAQTQRWIMLWDGVNVGDICFTEKCAQANVHERKSNVQTVCTFVVLSVSSLSCDKFWSSMLLIARCDADNLWWIVLRVYTRHHLDYKTTSCTDGPDGYLVYNSRQPHLPFPGHSPIPIPHSGYCWSADCLQASCKPHACATAYTVVTLQ